MGRLCGWLDVQSIVGVVGMRADATARGSFRRAGVRA